MIYSKEDIGVGLTFQNSVGTPCYVAMQSSPDNFIVDVGDEHTINMARDYMWDMMQKGYYTVVSKEDVYEIF
jgi:hypothetical protein